MRARARRLAMGLATVLGIARRGYFIPYRYAGSLPPSQDAGAYSALESLFDDRRSSFAAELDEIDALAAELEGIETGRPGGPRWAQGWFARLDAATAYAMVRRRRPSCIVEIGSGHSTRFMTQAIRDGALATRFVSIDPAPRAALQGLDIERIARPLHDTDSSIFAALGPGDILFIDSSHILMPGTDVDLLINRIWPTLADGVLVHFHDIFLPDDYPVSWGWRGYNEQLAVAPLITGRGSDILFSSHFVVTRMHDTLNTTVVARLPMISGAVETSLWLRKRAARGATP